MKNKLFVITIIFLLGCIVWFMFANKSTTDDRESSLIQIQEDLSQSSHPLSIVTLRNRNYPGSEIQFSETLEKGSNYTRYIASYESDGNTIYGLLTIPDDNTASKKYPVIVMIHGYIQPNVYKTTERYVTYQDNLAKSGFITFKIDLRGHGNSEGEPGGHFSEYYTVDTLNAISSLKKLPQADPENVGVWGHSNGGEIGLRTMVISNEINVGVFWAGVVGSFEGMLETYNKDISFMSLKRSIPDLVKENGLPSQNPEFWNQIDPYVYLSDVSGAIQLHHGTADSSVPVSLSIQLKDALEKERKQVEYYEYEDADHNLSDPAFGPAMQRTVEFFKKNLNQSLELVSLPINDFYERITKKSFGDYISKENSTVQPEKFEGYHTGVDVEYEDVSEDVPVFAVCDGEIVFSDWVSGYGGTLVLKCVGVDTSYYVVYGHLDAESIVDKNKVQVNQKIAELGNGGTNETDFERKHLHFGVHKSWTDFKGYVSNKRALEEWIDPREFIGEI